MSKLVDLDGLREFWTKAKAYIDSKTSSTSGGGTFVISDFADITINDIIIDVDNVSATPTTSASSITKAVNAGKSIVVQLFDDDNARTESFTATVDKCEDGDVTLVLNVTPNNHSDAGLIYINMWDYNGQVKCNFAWRSIGFSNNAIYAKSVLYAPSGSEAWKAIRAGYTMMTSQTSLTLTSGGNHNVAIIPSNTTARTITLPAGSADGETFTIRRLYNGVSAAVTVKCASANSFQLCNSSNTYTYSTGYSLSTSLYRAVRFIFYSNKWYIVTDD